LARNLIQKFPTNNLSDPEHAQYKENMEICTFVEQKPFPFTPSSPSITQKPRQQPIRYGTSQSQKRAFFEICPRKKVPLPLISSPLTTNHQPPK
jgi:hypothetical protein